MPQFNALGNTTVTFKFKTREIRNEVKVNKPSYKSDKNIARKSYA